MIFQFFNLNQKKERIKDVDTFRLDIGLCGQFGARNF